MTNRGLQTLALLAGVFSAVQGAAQVSPSYRITGVVVSERGGAPVPNCHIMANSSGGSAQQRPQRQRAQQNDSNPSTDTDASGHFSLALPSAGSWQLYASGRGFRSQGFDRHENFYFSAVVLTPAAPTFDLIFRVEPDSQIEGFVLDEAGEGARNARVTLFAAESQNPDIADALGPVRASTGTDDRGHYEFAGLAPGDYNVAVQAEPWYAAGSQRRFSNSGSQQPVDPQLDVVYPQTWFPGVTDRRSAEVLSLHHGEARQADLNLTPAPATHLHIAVPGGEDTVQGVRVRRGQIFPQVERVSQEGLPFLNTSVQIDPQGQIDIGGLSPGLYKVTMQGQGAAQTPAFIRVPGEAQHSIDLSSAIPVAELTLHFDMEGEPGRMQVILTDVDTGSNFISYAQGNLQRRRNAGEPAEPGADRKLEVPPGQYRVTLAGQTDAYLAGLAMKDAQVSGRMVTVGSGSTTLNLKVSRGRASVHGTVSASEKPLAAAMVMLVPATMGQPGSITVLRRDQTNTDGSFAIDNVIPGDYILLAIDNGWTVNWHDPSTLEKYLVHGVPIAAGSNASIKQDLVAQTP